VVAIWNIDQRKLRWWGKEHDWYSQDEIAHGLGVAPSTLSRVLNGKSSPGHELLARMRLVFGAEGFADIATVTEAEADA
jgi:transcriptional regulator with XRE-family HTH domain